MIQSVDITDCYLCGAPGETCYEQVSDRFFGIAGDWSIRVCTNSECALSWLNPRPLPDELSKLYLDYLTHDSSTTASVTEADTLLNRVFRLRHSRQTTDQQNRNDWLALLLLGFAPYREMVDGLTMWLDVNKKRRVLDVGCGNGDFLERMRFLDWDAVGLETDPVSRQLARNKGIEVLDTGLLELERQATPFDVITMSHVVEHLPDPLAYLKKCRELLGEQGQLVILTPNVLSLSHKKYREFWVDLDPPRHLYHFSPSNLSAMVQTAGFRIDEVRTTARMASPRWRASALLKKRGVIPGYRLPKDHGLTKASGIALQIVEHIAAKFTDVGEEILLTATRN